MIMDNLVRRARAIAFYLPQFHPIPENDKWWGKGFTEWTNVGKAKPLFKGHHQPLVPADLGYYDLRVSETREAQADLARQYGIEAFCYWHYWFAGDRLLERPFNEVLESGRPDFPFCLAWANHSWTGVWVGAHDRMLKEQTYPGRSDYERHFDWLMRAFEDPRYVTVDGKPLFMVFRPNDIPNVPQFTEQFHEMAIRRGLNGIHLVGIWGESSEIPVNHGFDGATMFHLTALNRLAPRRPLSGMLRAIRRKPNLGWPLRKAFPRPMHFFPYEEAAEYFVEQRPLGVEYYPTAIPNFDNTPRAGWSGLVLQGSTPELFRKHFRRAVDRVQSLPPDRKLVFIKSWNEWAEGNILEPELRFGHDYLRVIRDEILECAANEAVLVG